MRNGTFARSMNRRGTGEEQARNRRKSGGGVLSTNCRKRRLFFAFLEVRSKFVFCHFPVLRPSFVFAVFVRFGCASGKKASLGGGAPKEAEKGWRTDPVLIIPHIGYRGKFVPALSSTKIQLRYQKLNFDTER